MWRHLSRLQRLQLSCEGQDVCSLGVNSTLGTDK
jgi:hypothetical protein